MRPETRRETNPIKRLKRYFFHPYRGMYRRRRWIYYPLAGIGVLGLVAVLLSFGRPTRMAPKASGSGVLISASPATPQLEREDTDAKVGALLDEGAQALADGDVAAAAAAFSAATAIDPGRSEAWNGVGLALLAKDKAGDALQAFERALRLDTLNARVYANRARALRSLNRLPEAIASAKESVRLDPANPLYSNRYYLMRIQSGEGDAVRSEVKSATLLKIESMEANAVVAAAALDLINGEAELFREKLGRARGLLPQATLNALMDDPVLVPYADNIRGLAGSPSPPVTGSKPVLP